VVSEGVCVVKKRFRDECLVLITSVSKPLILILNSYK
jgi:hypothetical protein